MKEWNELPKAMRNEKVKYYYDILQKHQNFITNSYCIEYYD